METGLVYDQKSVFSDNPKQKNGDHQKILIPARFLTAIANFEFLEEMFITRVCYHPNLRYF